jgi:leucyl aminopeptidase
MHPVFTARSKTARPIWFVTLSTFAKVVAKLGKNDRAYVKAAGFEPKSGRSLILPSGAVLSGLESNKDDYNAFLPGLLPGVLPAGTYRFANASRATARARTRRCGWCCPTASMVATSRVSPMA